MIRMPYLFSLTLTVTSMRKNRPARGKGWDRAKVLAVVKLVKYTQNLNESILCMYWCDVDMVAHCKLRVLNLSVSSELSYATDRA